MSEYKKLNTIGSTDNNSMTLSTAILMLNINKPATGKSATVNLIDNAIERMVTSQIDRYVSAVRMEIDELISSQIVRSFKDCKCNHRCSCDLLDRSNLVFSGFNVHNEVKQVHVPGEMIKIAPKFVSTEDIIRESLIARGVPVNNNQPIPKQSPVPNTLTINPKNSVVSPGGVVGPKVASGSKGGRVLKINGKSQK